MIAFRGWATPRLVSFSGLIQKIRRAPPPLSYGSPTQEDNQVLKFGAISFRDILPDPSGGFRLPFPSALQFAGGGVGTCSRHNLYHTGYTLLINKGWLVFRHLDFNLDLSTCVHRADCIWPVLCPHLYWADIDFTCYRHLSRDF